MNPNVLKKYAITTIPLLIVISILFAVFTVHHRDVNDVLLKDVDAMLAEIAFQNAVTIDTQMNGDIRFLKSFARHLNDAKHADFEQLKRAVFMESQRDDFKRVTIVDPNRISHSAEGAPLDLKNSLVLASIEKSFAGEFAISEVYEDPREKDTHIFAYTLPIFAPDNIKIIAVLIAIRPVAFFHQVLNYSSYDGKAWSLMIDHEGNAVAVATAVHNETQYNGAENYFTALRKYCVNEEQVNRLKNFMTEIQEKRSGKFKFEINGHRRISSFTPLKNNPAWYVITVLPEHEAMATPDLIIAQTQKMIAIVVALFLIVLLINYSVQRKARLAVEAAMTQLQILADNVPGGVITTEIDAGFTLIYGNKGWYNLAGTTLEYLRDHCHNSSITFVHPDDLERVGKKVMRQMERGGEVEDEHRMLNANGETIWVYLRGRKIILPDKHAVFNAIITDVTSLKKAEDERVEFLSQIELSQAKEKAKNMFLANISHDIRTPINAIIGMTYFLNKTELDPTQRGYVNKMKGAADILQQLVNDILDLAKMSEAKISFSYEAFNLYEVAAQAVDMFVDKCEQRGVKMTLDYQLDPNLFVLCDRTRIFQVMMNLISNAAKFTEHGKITVAIKALEQSSQNVNFVFSVTDTGVGIPADAIGKIWNEFEQVENTLSKFYQGTGLGLSLCKRIVEQMNGTVSVTSEIGVGSTFTFTLDLKIERNREAQNRNENNPTTSLELLRGKRILLVEDNEINSEIGKMVIEELGMICETAFDGVEALQTCSGKPLDYYDVILTDIHMPRMDGYQTSNILKREMLIKSPIFALTATVIDESMLENYREVIAGVLMKPIAPDILARKLTAIFVAKNKKNNDLPR